MKDAKETFLRKRMPACFVTVYDNGSIYFPHILSQIISGNRIRTQEQPSKINGHRQLPKNNSYSSTRGA